MVYSAGSFKPAVEKINSGGDLLSQDLTVQVSSALEGLTSVFGMGTGVAPPATPPGLFFILPHIYLKEQEQFSDSLKGEMGQASRSISTGRLSALLRLHLQPIDLVVYQGPLGDIHPGRPNLGVGFTLRCFQRLSRPDMAARHCRWCDNRNTGGPSILVLSY